MNLLPFTPIYPFEKIINPYLDIITANTNDWIDTAYNMLSQPARSKYKQMNIGALTALCFPRATVYQRLVPLAQWILWGIMLDDYYEPCSPAELAVLREQLNAILRGGPFNPQDNGIFKQAASLRDHLQAFMPGHWMQRFISSQDTQFEGMILESPYKLSRRTPLLDEYVAIREKSIAIYPMLDLLEVQEGAALPDDIARHPVIRRLGTLATRLTSWLNDFYTLPKELLRGNDTFNLILVLRHAYNISLEEAHAEAMQIHDTDLEEFLSLQKTLPDFGKYNIHVANYVQDMGLFLQGQKTWYEEHTTRYLPGGYVESEYDPQKE